MNLLGHGEEAVSSSLTQPKPLSLLLTAAVSELSFGSLRVARFPAASNGLRGLQAARDIAAGETLMSVPLDLILLPVPHKPARRKSPSLSSSSELYQLSAKLCRVLTEAESNSLEGAGHIRKCLLGEAGAEAAITAAAEVVELRLRLKAQIESDDDGTLGYYARFLASELAAPAERWVAQQRPPGTDRRLWLACCYWVNTRVVHCPVLNQPALVPYFDLFNHSPEVSVQTDYDPGSRRFTLTTLTPYAAGNQVYINYGNHSNLNLLAEYNFVLLGPAGAVLLEHDSLPVDITTMVSLPPDKVRSFLDELHVLSLCPHASEHTLSDQGLLAKYFHLSMDGPSYYLLLLLMTFKSGGSGSLSTVLNSFNEEQMLEQLSDRLLCLYRAVHAQLLRDRNHWLLQMAHSAASSAGSSSSSDSFLENCLKLIDIWCDIVNTLMEKA